MGLCSLLRDLPRGFPNTLGLFLAIFGDFVIFWIFDGGWGLLRFSDFSKIGAQKCQNYLFLADFLFFHCVVALLLDMGCRNTLRNLLRGFTKTLRLLLAIFGDFEFFPI